MSKPVWYCHLDYEAYKDLERQMTPCILWSGAVGTDGYGVISLGRGRLARAHRVAYEQINGPIRDGLCVLHRCDTPLCVNPDHLWLGTRTDNSNDKVAKGRIPHGESHWNSKLNPDAVNEIRRLARDGISSAQIAKGFNVNRRTISEVIAGTAWRRVTDAP